MKITYRILMRKSPYRKDRDKLAQQPIQRSRYAQSLWEVGAGWK